MSSTNDTDPLPWYWGDATPAGPALTDRAQRVRERRRGHRPPWVDVLGLAFVIAFFGFAIGWTSNGVLWINHQSASVNDWDTLPACATEDSVNCYWDAARGNGEGRSFINWDGVTYYAED